MNAVPGRYVSHNGPVEQGLSLLPSSSLSKGHVPSFDRRDSRCLIEYRGQRVVDAPPLVLVPVYPRQHGPGVGRCSLTQVIASELRWGWRGAGTLSCGRMKSIVPGAAVLVGPAQHPFIKSCLSSLASCLSIVACRPGASLTRCPHGRVASPRTSDELLDTKRELGVQMGVRKHEAAVKKQILIDGSKHPVTSLNACC